MNSVQNLDQLRTVDEMRKFLLNLICFAACIEELEVIRTVRRELPEVFNQGMERDVIAMLRDAVECEAAFGEDVLVKGVAGMSLTDLRKYLEYVANRRLESLGIIPVFGSNNPFDFMQLQDVQELANFFERRVSAYQLGVTGEVVFSEEF